MFSSFWLLGVESPDASHAEKEMLGKLSKMTIFTQNGPSSLRKNVVIL